MNIYRCGFLLNIKCLLTFLQRRLRCDPLSHDNCSAAVLTFWEGLEEHQLDRLFWKEVKGPKPQISTRVLELHP